MFAAAQGTIDTSSSITFLKPSFQNIYEDILSVAASASGNKNIAYIWGGNCITKLQY